jgi:hypothetical protein
VRAHRVALAAHHPEEDLVPIRPATPAFLVSALAAATLLLFAGFSAPAPAMTAAYHHDTAAAMAPTQAPAPGFHHDTAAAPVPASSPLTPAALDAMGARGEAAAAHYAATQRPSAVAASGSGFAWSDAGVGFAAALAILLAVGVAIRFGSRIERDLHGSGVAR